MSSLHEKTEDTIVMLMHEMTEVIRIETKLKESEATQMATALVKRLRERMGGQDVYIPAADKDERDIGILKDYKGTPESLVKVMCKYGVSKRTVYRVMRRRKFLLGKKI